MSDIVRDLLECEARRVVPPQDWTSRAMEEILRLRAALSAQPAAVPTVTADDFFTLLGHAQALRMEGQTDMPAYFYGLAERIAPDAEHADRARRLAAAPQAPQQDNSRAP